MHTNDIIMNKEVDLEVFPFSMNAKQYLIFMMRSEETVLVNISYSKHFRNFVTIQDIPIFKMKKSNVFYRFCEKNEISDSLRSRILRH